jgi:hypothetical protein
VLISVLVFQFSHHLSILPPRFFIKWPFNVQVTLIISPYFAILFDLPLPSPVTPLISFIPPIPNLYSIALFYMYTYRQVLDRWVGTCYLCMCVYMYTRTDTFSSPFHYISPFPPLSLFASLLSCTMNGAMALSRAPLYFSAPFTSSPTDLATSKPCPTSSNICLSFLHASYSSTMMIWEAHLYTCTSLQYVTSQKTLQICHWSLKLTENNLNLGSEILRTRICKVQNLKILSTNLKNWKGKNISWHWNKPGVKQVMLKQRNKIRLYLKFETVLQKPTVNCKIMYLDFSQFQPEYVSAISFMDSKVRSQLTDVRLV